MTLVAAFLSVPVIAQQPAQTGAATPSDPASTPPATAAPATPGVVATTNNPNLAVATVRLENGARASKLIGGTVYTDTNEKVGAVDDLIMTQDDRVTVAIVSVGGFLGLGSKLVAVPFPQLKVDGERITLPGATKDSLNAMPSFVY
jgi:sporulation protein YlmC with PRC-barrel domain